MPLSEPTRRQFLALSAAAAAGAALAPGARAGALLRGGRRADLLEWSELRDGVWAAIGQGGNAMLARGAEGALLVDTKLAGFGDALRREAEARAKPLKLVINTHHHADHSGGNYAFGAGERLIAHEKAAARIGAQTERYVSQIRSALSGAGLPEELAADLEALRARVDDLAPEDWTPGEVVAGARADWALGDDLAIEAHHFGAGHTDNDMAIRLPQRNVVHAGDLFFHQMHPFFDPDGGVSCRGWTESVRRTIELCDAETVVIPGHGAVSDVEGLKGQLSYLEKLWHEVGELVQAGWEREVATTMQWPFMDGLQRPELRPRAIGVTFDEHVRAR